MNNTIPSVIAAARVAERLAREPGGVAQSRLAAELDLSQSTCYRILQSLAACGWATKSPGGLWRCGGAFATMAAATSEAMLDLDSVRAALNRVATRHGVASKFSIRRGIEQFVAVRAEREGEVRVTGSEGVSFSVVEGSSGAALLADSGDAAAKALFSAAPPSKTDLKFLLDALAHLRKLGWCGRRRIADWPVSALSSPVRDASGAVAGALTFLVPENRFTDPSLPRLLLKTADSLSQRK